MINLNSFHIDYLKTEDAKSLSEMMVSNSERFKRYFPVTLSKNTTFESSQRYIIDKNNEYESKSEYTFAIKESISNLIAGIVIIKEINWEIKQGEFAYCIDFKYENKGFMSRSINAISEYAFEIIGLEKLQIIVHKDNIASVKVAQKCHFIWQKTLLNEYTPPNESPLNMELYELKNEK
ncbi:GNAT family N-acetyltransferase [Flavobacterium sp.]|uniref:GNAT family N-acetyltransferase n=1 Tax=Flavobacterium sp. TaxID=239 RepID=UPI00286B2FCA|nr:GNAT family N-acetyltransferase [Flavobacterium sp.]